MADIKRRTSEELRQSRYNYFIALRVGVAASKKQIEDAISSLQGDTNKDSSYDTRLRELVPDMQDTLINDNTKKQEEKDSAIRFKLNDGLELLKDVASKNGIIYTSYIKDVTNSLNPSNEKYFELADLKNAFIAWDSSKTIKYIDDIADCKIKFIKIDEFTAKMQDTFKKNNFYEYLGVSQNATDIETAIEAAFKRDGGNTARTKEGRVAKELQPFLLGILSKQPDRKYYDYYILTREKVWKPLALRNKCGIKEISLNEFLEFANILKSILKIDISEVEVMLCAGLREYRLMISGGDRESLGLKPLEICPYDDCGKIFEKGLKSCPHCGRPLEVLCWNCGKPIPFTKDDKECSACHATRHGQIDFEDKCKKLDALLSNPMSEVSALQNALLGIKNVVPNWDAKAESKLCKKAKEYEKTIKDRAKIENELGGKYKEELAKIQELKLKKQYQGALALAKSLLVKYSTYNVDNSKKLIAEISNILLPAQRFFVAAQTFSAQNNEAMAVANAVKAVDICDDYTEARQILQKYPPKPVVNVVAKANGDKIKLEWNESVKQEYVTYTIIKKIGLPPTKIDDGSVVDRGLSLKFYEDENIVSATPYYYAVFVERYGVCSTLCATQNAVAVFSDVKNVTQNVVDGGISVTWTAPQNVKSIEVWRNAGSVAPSRPGEGTKVDSTQNGFVDAKCVGENSYLIVCNYELKGQKIKSRGVQVVFKPFEKTVPLQNVRIETRGKGKFALFCSDGYNGKIRLYYSQKPINVQFDKALRFIDFNTICKGLVSIDYSTGEKGELNFSLPIGKIYYVYPMVGTEQLFVVSAPQLLNVKEGPNFPYTVADGIVQIKGALPTDVNALAVVINHEKFADKIDEGEKYVFKRNDFSKNGVIECRLKADALNYITLFFEYADGDVTTYSMPSQLEPVIDYRETVSVFYTIDCKPSASKPFKITITFDANKGVEIPELVVVYGNPRPIDINSGKICGKIEAFTLTKPLFSSKYSAKKVIKVDPTSPNAKFKLFTSDTCSHVKLKLI